MRFDHHIPEQRLTNSYKDKLLNGMKSNGPTGNIYVQVSNRNITEYVKYFWVKELIYTIIHFLKNNFSRKKSSELNKILKANIVFYIKERSAFDNKFNQVIKYRNDCLAKYN
jgi:hypothetical protein